MLHIIRLLSDVNRLECSGFYTNLQIETMLEAYSQ